MNSEQQQQRIMGYFIEEAREHLQTIEQGVLNLQEVLDDSESINELFRAAHSIKGGAAMLGVGSIQHVAHRLEDFFKILKENPQIIVDERLKSLLLAGFDPLAELLDELQSEFKVSDELTLETNNRVKPVFVELESYLNQLAANPNEQQSSEPLIDKPAEIIFEDTQSISSQESIFQEDVTTKMRDMLQLFRSHDSQESRSQLQDVCTYFQEIGNKFDLRNWSYLATQVKNAIAQPSNSYRTLAPILIRELKEAQDLVLANREAQIVVSSQIQNLLPYRFSESEDDEVSTIFTTAFDDVSDKLIVEDEQQIADISANGDLATNDDLKNDLDIPTSEEISQPSLDTDSVDLFANEEESFDLLEVPQDQIDQMDWMDSEYEITENQHIDGPKVGASELKSLAVLFENDDIDFDAAWEDIESNESKLSSQGVNQASSHSHDEFADLLDNSSESLENSSRNNLNLGGSSSIDQLFGDFSTDELTTQANQESTNLFPEDVDFLEDLNFNETDTLPNQNLAISNDDIQSDLGEINNPNLIADNSNYDDFNNLDLGIDIIDEISEIDINSIIDNTNISDNSTDSSSKYESDNDIDAMFFDEDASINLTAPSSSKQLLENQFIEEQEDQLSLSSEQYFAELAREDQNISNEFINFNEFNEFIEVNENNEPFALTVSEENMALLEDPFAITEHLEEELLESPSNIGMASHEKSIDTSALNIFDELGFDDESVGNSREVITTENSEINFDEFTDALLSNNSDYNNSEINNDINNQIDDLFFDVVESVESIDSNNLSDVDKELQESQNLESFDSELNNLETENLDFFDQNYVSQEAQEVNAVDEFGGFFDDADESKFIPSESELNNADDLGDFFDVSEDDETVYENLNSITQAPNISNTDNLDELGDFLTESQASDPDSENFAEDFIDNNWSSLNASSEENLANIENEFDQFSDANLTQEINSNSADLGLSNVVTDSNFIESLGDDFFQDINAISSSNESNDIADLFANTNEDDLTVLESNFGDNLGFDQVNEFDTSVDIDLPTGQGLLKDENLTNIQNTQDDFNDNLDLDGFSDNDDVTASTTLDNLADFFQGDEDDLDISEITHESTYQEALLSNQIDMDETLEFGDFDALTTLIESKAEASDVVTINSMPNQISAEELNNIDDNFDFDDLEAMIGSSGASPNNYESVIGEVTNQIMNTYANSNGHSLINAEDTNFAELEALLGDSSGLDSPISGTSRDEADTLTAFAAPKKSNDDFDELENMLQSAFAKDVGPIKTKTPTRPAVTQRKQKLTDSTMRVDVRYLDSLNNLVGELVVNRNLLEQEQERLQQFITNLLHQVQLLSDVSQRMRDQYDRSLLEASLASGRGRSYSSSFDTSYSSDGSSPISNASSDFEGIEFDRYNTFHVLSQEIIELIVKVRESASDIEFVVGETDQVTRQLGTITTQVQDDLKQSRMVPFAQIADRLPRGIRDRALKTGKQAELEIYGRETLIDKAILESLTDPLTHLVNNAIDHGLEDPATRQAAGKPSTGKLTVRAYHQGNQTVISISDDGAGISTEKVKKSAVGKGVRTQAEVDCLNDTEVYSLLFEPGFSTAAEADEFKGRGVGLDVVKTCLDDIRGVIIVESVVGKGTTFTIRLPLTLSISKAMFCISDRARIAFPVDGFEDMVEVPQSQIVLNEKGQPCLPWRDTILPFQHLSNLLAYSRHLSRSNIYGKQDNDELCIIILRNDTNYLALQVDQFLGEYEIVIKQLEGPIPQPAGIAGATVLGDGRVMAIANVLELFDIASGRLRPSTSGITIQPTIEEDVAADPTVLIVDDSITVRELLSLTFAKVGYRVEQAKDGQDAWEKLRAGLPCDMIFCDIEMPRMDGLDLLSRLQKDSRLKEIPVAMLTSRGADRHRQSAIQLGAKGYFTKPYLEEELLSASKRLLNGETLPI